MQDHPIGIPACFTSSEKQSHDHDPASASAASATVTRSGQSVFMSLYRTKIADQSRLITITWCKNLLLHGLSVSVDGPDQLGDHHQQSKYTCKVELKPWYFWRKQGSKRFFVDGKVGLDIFWDLKGAKFNGETEPISEYYVAVVCNEEVVLLLGDLKKDAYRKTGCRPALLDPILVSRKEHIFGKKKFCTRVKFHEKGRSHEISIECNNNNNNNRSNGIFSGNGVEPEMEIRLDGNLVILVKHLQWKFRGNEVILLSKLRVEVYWDVHDWLFSPGLRHALFIFKPIITPMPSSSLSISSSSPTLSSLTSTPMSSDTSGSGSSVSGSGSGSSFERISAGGPSEFCLFLYAWKVE